MVRVIRGKAMNIMEVEGYKAKIEYDPELDQFRERFLGLMAALIFTASLLQLFAKNSRILLKSFWRFVRKIKSAPLKSFQANSISEFHRGFTVKLLLGPPLRTRVSTSGSQKCSNIQYMSDPTYNKAFKCVPALRASTGPGCARPLN